MADVSYYIEENDEEGRDGEEESNEHPVFVETRGGGVGELVCNLRPLEQLQKCVLSDDAWKRPMVGSVLLQVMRDFTANGGPYLKDLPAIMNLVEEIITADITLVKTDFIEQIPQLAVVCMESSIPEMNEAVEKYLLPLVVNCFKDTDTQVRKTSQATILVLMEHSLVSKHIVELKVCPTVLDISRDYVNSEDFVNAEDYVAGAINFMSKLAPLLGKDATERLFLNRFSELCSYDRFSVRKMCAASIGEFCAVVGTEAYEKVLLPRFIGLCGDDIWGVRKYCAEVIMSVSCACPPHLRRTVLAPAFERLLDDTSRWVRISAFQNLGPFISTFANPRITGIAYSQTGELVIINPKGTEFRLNSPAFTDVIHSINYDEKFFNSPLRNYFEELKYNRYYDDNNSSDSYKLLNTYNNANKCEQPNSESGVNNVSNNEQDNLVSSPLYQFFNIIKQHPIDNNIENSNESHESVIVTSNHLSVEKCEKPNSESDVNINNEDTEKCNFMQNIFTKVRENFTLVNRENEEQQTSNNNVSYLTNDHNYSSAGGDKNVDITISSSSSSSSTPMDIDEEVSEIVIIENTEKQHNNMMDGDEENILNTIPLYPTETTTTTEPPSIVINQENTSENDQNEQIISESEEWLKPRNKNKERRRNKKLREQANKINEIIAQNSLVQINLDNINAITNDLSSLKISDTTATSNNNIVETNCTNSHSVEDIVVDDDITTTTTICNSEIQNSIDTQQNIIPPTSSSSDNSSDVNVEISDSDINVDNNVTLSTTNDSCSLLDQNSCTSDSSCNNDELEKYNSHQYWYISPELPLDMSIIEASKQSLSQSTIEATSSNNQNVDRIKLYSEILMDGEPDDIITEQTKHNTSISTFRHLESPKQHIVPQLLIEHYTSMTDPVLASLTDAELGYHCAFSFPAVALTLGKENWELLHKTYITLAADIQWKVRRAVAGSLHEVATILGENLATEHLAPIFDDLIKDVDVVRIGALKHMAYFFKIINPQRRNQYLPRLAEFLNTDSALNWRYRCELANQLLLSIPLWTGRDVGRHILPLAKELLQDKVAAVRAAAVLLVSDLIHHVEAESLNKRVLPNVAQVFNVHFAHSKSWVRRQTFATLCAKLVTQHVLPPETFAQDVMPHFLDLSWDPVANVRLAVAKTLANNILKNEYFADPKCTHNEPLLKVLRRLQSDKDRDVRQAAVF